METAAVKAENFEAHICDDVRKSIPETLSKNDDESNRNKERLIDERVTDESLVDSKNNIEIENLNEIYYSEEIDEPSITRKRKIEETLESDLENDDIPGKYNFEGNNVILIDYEKQNTLDRTFWDCPYCPYKASKSDFIRTHIADTHASVTCYKCQVCQYAHPQLSLLMEHVSRKHAKVKYQCPSCKCKFTTLWNCEGHIMIRHPKKAQKLLQTVSKKREISGVGRRCPFCEFMNNSPGILKRHVENEHPEVLTFKCSYCIYKNEDIDDITEHMCEVHPEESGDIDL